VFGVFQHLKGLQEHVSLPLAVMNLPDWPSEGVFNRSASRDSDGAMKFRCTGSESRSKTPASSKNLAANVKNSGPQL